MENVFNFREQLIDEYSCFSRSFARIDAADIREAVHRIDDNGAGALGAVVSSLLSLQDAVDDRDKEGEGFPRAGTRRNYVALSQTTFG